MNLTNRHNALGLNIHDEKWKYIADAVLFIMFSENIVENPTK
jgi:hypothetical protein